MVENDAAVSNEVNCLYTDTLIEARAEEVKQKLSQCSKTSFWRH